MLQQDSFSRFLYLGFNNAISISFRAPDGFWSSLASLSMRASFLLSPYYPQVVFSWLPFCIISHPRAVMFLELLSMAISCYGWAVPHKFRFMGAKFLFVKKKSSYKLTRWIFIMPLCLLYCNHMILYELPMLSWL